MPNTSFLTFLHLYLSRKKRLKQDIANIRSECHRLIRKYRRYLNVRNKLVLALVVLNNSYTITRREVWSYKKNDKWWTNIVPMMTDIQFKENFRLERSTVSELIKQMTPYLQKNDTNYRLSIPVQKRVCCALYSLGSSSELRTVSNLFGVGKSTAAQILHDFCSTLIDLFFYRLIQFPNTNQQIQDTIDGFTTKCGYPMCLGALDGTHLNVKPPTGSEIDYYNYKKFHSIIMLAVVNSNLEFTYINVGAPGRCNDASVYARSTLSQVIKSSIYEKCFMMLNNVKVQCHLIADSAFPLDYTLMKPFPERTDMPRNLSLFNYRLSRARCSVERAFGLLKNRFRCLHKKLEFDLDNSTNIIKATAILHNLCIIYGDRNEIEWDLPQTVYKKPSCNGTTNVAIDVRYALTDFFLQNPL